MSTPTAEQRYGWYSSQHEQSLPGSACIYEAPDGQRVSVHYINHSSTDPGGYKWPDAQCVGPVLKYVAMSSRERRRLDQMETMTQLDFSEAGDRYRGERDWPDSGYLQFQANKPRQQP